MQLRHRRLRGVLSGAFILADSHRDGRGAPGRRRPVGISIKNVADIVSAAKINAFIFDKTGTLTTGQLAVSRLAPLGDTSPPNSTAGRDRGEIQQPSHRQGLGQSGRQAGCSANSRTSLKLLVAGYALHCPVASAHANAERRCHIVGDDTLELHAAAAARLRRKLARLRSAADENLFRRSSRWADRRRRRSGAAMASAAARRMCQAARRSRNLSPRKSCRFDASGGMQLAAGDSVRSVQPKALSM